jgi:hypothetical protein
VKKSIFENTEKRRGKMQERKIYVGREELKREGYKKERVNKKISYVVLYVRCLMLYVGTLQ